MRMATTKRWKMEQRRPRQKLRVRWAHHLSERHCWKFSMAIFTSFNPKTMYISTFFHVAARSTSTPSSPSQPRPAGWQGWEMAAKETSLGGPPPPTHTHTLKLTLDYRVCHKFDHTKKHQGRSKGVEVKEEAMLSKCRNQGQNSEGNLI